MWPFKKKASKVEHRYIIVVYDGPSFLGYYIGISNGDTHQFGDKQNALIFDESEAYSKTDQLNTRIWKRYSQKDWVYKLEEIS